MFFLSAKQPRRIRVIENTLTQRRTVSTLFWGMRYGINDFMGLLPKLDSNTTTGELKRLINAGLVVQSDASHYLLTAAGAAWVHKAFHQFDYHEGVKMNARFNLRQFRSRFLLAVQIVSEFSYQNSHYYPMLINDREDQFIKQWFHHFKSKALVNELTSLLNAFLSGMSDQLAYQFSTILNGHSTTGMTIFQQAAKFKSPVAPRLVDEWQLFSCLVKFITIHQNDYPSLVSLLNGTQRSLVSNSAQQTYQMFLNRPQIDWIARARRIKLSTVREHLLEVAILIPRTNAYFQRQFDHSIWQYLESTYHGNIDDWQFSTIKNQFSNFDYFYFRMYQILRSHVDE
ncbi:helix-turn-helix domain-containing protein [Lactobacillus sp. Sy-1]|uniref:helix-turn-helix domain-containing protein n=1 Tax=Lactobacillus sp. Sy-1 TaxID=2109645 RepID=UPI001C595EAF|nr:helix-turn-helix domain-containing protein [Lactobacillus sp. Sy-1]